MRSDGLATHTISEAPFAPISKQMLPVYPMAFLIELNGWPFFTKSGNTCPSPITIGAKTS